MNNTNTAKQSVANANNYEPPVEQLNDLINACREAYEVGLVTATSGNASFIHNDVIYITKTGANLGRVGRTDLAIVSLDNTILQGIPSKELSAHRALFNHAKGIRAVLHLHGEYIAAYTCLAKEWSEDYPAVGGAAPLKVSDRILVLPYSHTNSQGDYDLFVEGAKRGPVFCQQNHGIFIGAKSMNEALSIGIILETNLKIYFLALSSGRPVRTLSIEEKTILFNRGYTTNLEKRHISY